MVDRARGGRRDLTGPGQAAEASAAVRVLVLTAPVGEGHLAAARALTEDIARRGDGSEVTVCDVLPALCLPLRWL